MQRLMKQTMKHSSKGSLADSCLAQVQLAETSFRPSCSCSASQVESCKHGEKMPPDPLPSSTSSARGGRLCFLFILTYLWTQTRSIWGGDHHPHRRRSRYHLYLTSRIRLSRCVPFSLQYAALNRSATKFPDLDADQTDRRVQHLYQRSRSRWYPLYVFDSTLVFGGSCRDRWVAGDG